MFSKPRLVVVSLLLTLLPSGCGLIEPIRWTTPTDDARQTEELAKRVEVARTALHVDHEALLKRDAAGLRASGESAASEAAAQIEKYDARVRELENQLATLAADAKRLPFGEILAAIVGGGLGTAGGRALSRSGKRIDEAKNRIDDTKRDLDSVYDDSVKTRERVAQLEGRLPPPA